MTIRKRGLIAAYRIIAVLLLLTMGTLLLNAGYHRYFKAVYPMDHAELVEAAGKEFGIPCSLIYAVIHTESSFQESAVSSAQAKGLMQLTDDTFQWALKRAGDSDQYTPEDLYDPAVNIHYGVYVLSLLREQFDDDDVVLAAYNAGQGRVKQWLADTEYSSDGVHLNEIPYPETREYIVRVKQAQKRYQVLYQIL